MPDNDTAERAVLSVLERGARSPRELEEQPPAPLTPREVRIAVQAMLDGGRVQLNSRLKLEPKK